MKLSIIVPLFNEEKTVKEVLKKLLTLRLPKITTEIIVINDGSSDTSLEEVASLKDRSLKVHSHKINKGKGEAVKTGIKYATGDFIVIQDADLEYDPKQLKALCRPLLTGEAEVVYGTRLKRLPRLRRDERTLRFFVHYIGNRVLSFITSLLYGQWITDMETCYKIFPRKIVKEFFLEAKGFDFEAEITAKLLRKGYHILELPITTTPRGYDEGKKLRTIRDGSLALWTLIKFRFKE